jgi:hypothetical protein
MNNTFKTAVPKTDSFLSAIKGLGFSVTHSHITRVLGILSPKAQAGRVGQISTYSVRVVLLAALSADRFFLGTAIFI